MPWAKESAGPGKAPGAFLKNWFYARSGVEDMIWRCNDETDNHGKKRERGVAKKNLDGKNFSAPMSGLSFHTWGFDLFKGI
jgi:hypothetical protein